MKLQTKVFIFIFFILVIAGVSIGITMSVIISSDGKKDIEILRQNEMSRIKQILKNYVDIAYETIEYNYQNNQNREDAKEKSKIEISKIRYDNKIGYFWINDTKEPFPSMIMHPVAPQLNGKILNNPKYNCALGRNENLFNAFVNIVKKNNGDGFVDYVWPKPSENGLLQEQPKLSYVRLFKPFGWIIGTGVYIDSIDKIVAKRTDAIYAANKNLIVTISIVMFVLFIFLTMLSYYLVNKFFISKILDVILFAKSVSQGDLTQSLNIDQKDEIGTLGDALKLMLENLRNMVEEISNTTFTLSGASEELTSISSEMASSAKKMNVKSETVAAASNQISVSVGTVAAASEQSSSSVSSIANMTEEMSSTFNEIVNFAQTTSENVKDMADASNNVATGINNTATSIEEMTTSLNEVAFNTTKASAVSNKAKQGAKDINIKMNNLVAASKQIGKIIGVIKDIADQTNMLALNATIEAAGAGEAGKGFAVVAGEVKELAKQSADATDEIASQVDEIQNSTNEAVAAINEISKVINEVSDITKITATAVEEQTSTANEISKIIAENALTVQDIAKKSNESATLVTEIAKSTDDSSKTAGEVARHVSELSAGINEVARSSSEVSMGVKDISKNIHEVNIASNETAKGATQTNESSLDLAKLAGSLSEIVGKFKV